MYTVDVRRHQASIKEDLRQHPETARIADTVQSLPSDLRDPMRVRLARATKVGIQKLEVRTHVVVRGGDAERARRLLASAERYCSILDTLRNPPEVEAAFTFDHVADDAPADAHAPSTRSEDSRHG